MKAKQERIWSFALPGVLLALLAMCFPALAGRASAEVRESVENSMLVTGTVDIDTRGLVTGYRLDRPDKLPEPVRELIAKVVPALRFEPALIDGKPTAGRAKMGLRVIPGARTTATMACAWAA